MVPFPWNLTQLWLWPMNRLGGKSNTGEGGEDPESKPTARERRYHAVSNQASSPLAVLVSLATTWLTLMSSKSRWLKVLSLARVVELPGHKVSGPIAKTRHFNTWCRFDFSTTPPRHFYSIEDLKQLIYDLKCSNPRARVSVKLVSETGAWHCRLRCGKGQG